MCIYQSICSSFQIQLDLLNHHAAMPAQRTVANCFTENRSLTVRLGEWVQTLNYLGLVTVGSKSEGRIRFKLPVLSLCYNCSVKLQETEKIALNVQMFSVKQWQSQIKLGVQCRSAQPDDVTVRAAEVQCKNVSCGCALLHMHMLACYQPSA